MPRPTHSTQPHAAKSHRNQAHAHPRRELAEDSAMHSGLKVKGLRPTARGGQLPQVTKARIRAAACADSARRCECAACAILRPIPPPSSMHNTMYSGATQRIESHQTRKPIYFPGAAAQQEWRCEGESGRKWCGQVAHLWLHRPGPLCRAAGPRHRRHAASESEQAA